MGSTVAQRRAQKLDCDHSRLQQTKYEGRSSHQEGSAPKEDFPRRKKARREQDVQAQPPSIPLEEEGRQEDSRPTRSCPAPRKNPAATGARNVDEDLRQGLKSWLNSARIFKEKDHVKGPRGSSHGEE